jgi:hypothetical protein
MRAQVEYAVTAWSCSDSSANVWANAIHAGPKRGSISDVLLTPRSERLILPCDGESPPEVLSCLRPLSTAQIPDADSVPTHGIFGFVINHFMSEYKEFGVEVREMIHAGNVQRHRWPVN